MNGQRRPVGATVRVSTDKRVATLNPSRNLKPGRVYTVKLTSRIKDAAGHTLLATSWKAKARR